MPDTCPTCGRPRDPKAWAIADAVQAVCGRGEETPGGPAYYECLAALYLRERDEAQALAGAARKAGLGTGIGLHVALLAIPAEWCH